MSRLLEALRKVDGLNDLKEISKSNFMMKIRIFLALFHDMRLPCAKRLDRLVTSFRNRSKRNPANLLEEASTSIYKEMEALGLSVSGIRPAALLLEKHHKSFMAFLKSLLRYRKARRGGGGGGESERTVLLLNSPTEEKQQKMLCTKKKEENDDDLFLFSGTKRKNHQRSRRRPKTTTITKTPKRVPREWEDEIRSLRDEVEMLRGVTKEFMQQNDDDDDDDVDDDMIRTMLMQQRELRAQNAQLKRQLGLYREAIETQDDVISEIDSTISNMYNSETSERLDSIRDRIQSARRRSARAQTSKLISSRQENMNIQGLQTLLEKSVMDLHDLIRTQRNGHGALADVFRSRREQAPNQLSIVCKNLRRLVRRLGRMGLSSFESISEEDDDDLERDRPCVRKCSSA